MNIGEQTSVTYRHSDGRDLDVTLWRTEQGLQIKVGDTQAIGTYTVVIPTDLLGAFAMRVFQRIAKGGAVDDLHTVFEGFLAVSADPKNPARLPSDS